MPALRFWDYIKAAFNAKPKGMFVAPNWIGLAAFGILGFLNPGWWLVGAGLEVGFLLWCASSRRFRKVINSLSAVPAATDDRGLVKHTLASLDAENRQRYLRLTAHCQDILRRAENEGADSGLENPARTKSLAHLAWVHLNLLTTRVAIQTSLSENSTEELSAGSLEEKMAEVNATLKSPDITDELRRSLEGRKRILTERLQKRLEAAQKLAFTQAEIERIEEQVRLMKDDTALLKDPAGLSHTIDQVSTEFAEAGNWVRDQRRIYQELGPLLDEPPPLNVLQPE